MAVTMPLPTVPIPTCCPPQPSARSASGTKFHFALNVSDLARSIRFYEILFQQPPAKSFADYAKFELDQPPLVFSLVPHPPAAVGAVSHFGLPVCSTEEVTAAATRLAAAGLSTTCQQNTVCGYARQDKVWVADPDHNHWEIYFVHEDVDPATVRQSFDGVSPTAADVSRSTTARESSVVKARVVWEHRVMQPAPARIPHADDTVDEVRLEGTFNSALTTLERTALLRDVVRVLKPKGVVHVHGLVSDRPMTGSLPSLPGVASLVKQVPVEGEPLAELRAAGLVNIEITKLPPTSVFRCGSAELRELKLSATKPAAMTSEMLGSRGMIYKGPFRRVVDETGVVFVRGVRTTVTDAVWERVSQSSAAAQFVFLGISPPGDTVCARC